MTDFVLQDKNKKQLYIHTSLEGHTIDLSFYDNKGLQT